MSSQTNFGTSPSGETTHAPQVGEHWSRRSDGKAVVRIGRVWRGRFGGVFDNYVRCHPVRGGKVWLTTIDEFVKRYALQSEGGSDDE